MRSYIKIKSWEDMAEGNEISGSGDIMLFAYFTREMETYLDNSRVIEVDVHIADFDHKEYLWEIPDQHASFTVCDEMIEEHIHPEINPEFFL